ncbi:DNA-binding protein [Actinomadura sp. NPDC000929]|uniref:DNA-binding protein n=1 Tax=Actinomadura sp. NPDC000929 TaxID=3154517 RepID=UPI003395EF21
MRPLTNAELAEFPPVVDISTAARALGLSRSYANQLAKQDQFPCKILRIGICYRVPTAALQALLSSD